MSTRGINIPLDVGASIAGMAGKTGNNTQGEDSPSSPSPARIIDIRNVLPTELGYISSFSMSPVVLPTQEHDYKYTMFDEDYWPYEYYPDMHHRVKTLNTFKMARVQHLVPYETAAGILRYIALAETGIFIVSPAATPDKGGNRRVGDIVEVVPFTVEDSSLFYLWSYAHIDGNLYCYRQGDEEVYIFGDLGTHLSLENLEVEHEIVEAWEDEIFQLVAAKPSFLNMKGQIGLFRANNRLGFWDSDGAIAWSSAFNKMDFTPDVVSLAGVTKFSSVVGTIIAILPTTRGFIIYSTSTIVGVEPLSTGDEQWKADIILSDSGIAYYFQAATGSNPEKHFAWTTSGMYLIANGKAEEFMVEEYRTLSAKSTITLTGYAETGQNYLYRLTVVGDSYLIISQASHWYERPANSDFQIGMIEGEYFDYPFFYPAPLDYSQTPNINDIIHGRWPPFPDYKLPADEWTVDPAALPDSTEGRPLIPCWSGYRYNALTYWEGFGVEADAEGAQPIPAEITSHMFPDVRISRSEVIYAPGGASIPNPMPTSLSAPKLRVGITDWSARRNTYDIDRPYQFFDRAGADFQGLLDEAIAEFEADRETLWELLDAASARLGWAEQLTISEPQTQMFVGRWEGEDPEFFRDGWHVKGAGLSTVSPEDRVGWFPRIKPTKLAPMGENFFNDAKPWFTGEVETSAYRSFIYPNRVTGASTKVPIKGIPVVSRISECGISVRAFVDELVYVGILGLDLTPFEEGERPHDWTCLVPESPLRGLRASVDSPWEAAEFPALNKPYALSDYPVMLKDFCKDSVCTPVPPVARAAISVEDIQPCAWNSRTRYPYGDSMGMVLISHQFRVFADGVYIPKSLFGKSLEEINHILDPDNAEDYPDLWIPIFEAEISGYGIEYNWGSNGSSFTKTISKGRLWLTNPEGECKPKERPKTWNYSAEEEYEFLENLHWTEGGEAPSLQWPWSPIELAPDELPGLPEANYTGWPKDLGFGATMREGTSVPYYPIYERAFVLDMQLGKWGSMDIPHSLVYSVKPPMGHRFTIVEDPHTFGHEYFAAGKGAVSGILPFGILPKFATPLGDGFIVERGYANDWDVWEAWYHRYYADPDQLGLVPVDSSQLVLHQMPVYLNRAGTGGRLVIQSTALTRDGYTKMVGVSGKGISKGVLEVSASIQGSVFPSAIPHNSYNYIPYSPAEPYLVKYFSWDYTLGMVLDERRFQDFRAPFVLTGKEFRVSIGGEFALEQLILYGQATGGLRFWGKGAQMQDV